MTIPVHEPNGVSRRRFLARAGVPAAAAAVAATSLPGVAHAETPAVVSDAPHITLAELRSMTSTPERTLYFVTDVGMGGCFATTHRHESH